MAGRRENDELTRAVEEVADVVQQLRPTHRTVTMWKDVRAALYRLNEAEFLLGLLPAKPDGPTDLDAVHLQLEDARALLGMIALALADGVEP